MTLSANQIISEVVAGRIEIKPFDRRSLGPNSYDVRLGSWYFLADGNIDELDPFDKDSVSSFWGNPHWVDLNGVILIPPRSTVLCHTKEVIGGRNGIFAQMHTRSSLARLGIQTHLTAGLGDIGYVNRWTAEISNNNQHTHVKLYVGMRFAQFTFEDTGDALAEYRGKYGSRSYRPWDPHDMLPRMWEDYEAGDILRLAGVNPPAKSILAMTD